MKTDVVDVILDIRNVLKRHQCDAEEATSILNTILYNMYKYQSEIADKEAVIKTIQETANYMIKELRKKC